MVDGRDQPFAQEIAHKALDIGGIGHNRDHARSRKRDEGALV
ncbi:hypothetical protein [Sphingomonas sanguinis]|nr:hypothetical protein [Sphingomonas sanguinis]